jgi:hypothetical protein
MGTLGDSLLAALKEQHQVLREAVEGLDGDALGWRPAEGANSLAMLITHVAEAEGRILRIALEGEVREHEELMATRQKSFDSPARTRAELLALLDGADREAERLAMLFDEANLARERTMRGRTYTSAAWVLRTVAHNGEHVGNALLTRQQLDASGR